MTLGAQLKTAREKKGYTLKQLSEISGLSIGFISSFVTCLTRMKRRMSLSGAARAIC